MFDIFLPVDSFLFFSSIVYWLLHRHLTGGFFSLRTNGDGYLYATWISHKNSMSIFGHIHIEWHFGLARWKERRRHSIKFNYNGDSNRKSNRWNFIWNKINTKLRSYRRCWHSITRKTQLVHKSQWKLIERKTIEWNDYKLGSNVEKKVSRNYCLTSKSICTNRSISVLNCSCWNHD